MSLRLKAALKGNLEEVMNAEVKVGSRAMRSAMEKTATFTQQRLRDQITGAGLGRKLSKSWQKTVYPLRGTQTMGPSALIYSKARKIVSAFADGVTIRSNNGFWLAIPTPAIPKRGTDGKRINPSNFPTHRFGPLKFVYRGKGKASLLVIEHSGITPGGRAKARVINSRSSGTSRLRSKGGASVIAFYMVPLVRLKKLLNIETVRRQAEAMLPREIVREWNRLDGD